MGGFGDNNLKKAFSVPCRVGSSRQGRQRDERERERQRRWSSIEI